MKRKPICPRCGSVDTFAIRSGMPEPELGGGSSRTRPLGGGMLGIDNPDRACRKCGHQWTTSIPGPRPQRRS